MGSRRGSMAVEVAPGAGVVALRPPVEMAPGGGVLALRRPSAIVPATPTSQRRPSAIVTVNNRRYMIGLLPGVSGDQPTSSGNPYSANKSTIIPSNDALTTILSALYCKLLVVLGLALPITQVLSASVPSYLHQVFYVYLYVGSLLFMCGMYATLIRDRAVFSIINAYHKKEESLQCPKNHLRDSRRINRYGSFYLRLGAVAFGIGSMVYSGLEFGQYFELKVDPGCHSLLQALTPALRMALSIIQMQFIFLNSQNMDMCRNHVVSRIGLMHMIATNLCEWLNVIVQETKHEILHLNTHPLHSAGLLNSTLNEPVNKRLECRRTNIMGSLVQNVSPFLFPCTIEYSLICAVIMFEMWRDVRATAVLLENSQQDRFRHYSCSSKSSHYFAVDCANAHKGLFSGIMVLVLTIISLIIFYVLKEHMAFNHTAIFEVNVCELGLYILSTVAVIGAAVQIRSLAYVRYSGGGLGLDNNLLLMAQGGMYIYSMFSIIGCYFTDLEGVGIWSEGCCLVQTTLQTIFVLDSWWRKCRNATQVRHKPGRQLVTFLLVANMSMWIVNTLEKNRAEFRPSHFAFYGLWPWTIITHVSMPLAIFYRFHSTICLFEIWKNAYKLTPHNLPS